MDMRSIVETIYQISDEQDLEVARFKEIERLQYMPYKEYLETRHWKNMRKVAIARADARCQVCNADDKELHVHHRTYERRGNERPEDLSVLCCECHEIFHKNGKLAQESTNRLV